MIPEDGTEYNYVCCWNCAYFLEMKARKGSPRFGECRRFPPSVAMIGDEVHCTWPIIQAESWCGEHLEGALENETDTSKH